MRSTSGRLAACAGSLPRNRGMITSGDSVSDRSGQISSLSATTHQETLTSPEMHRGQELGRCACVRLGRQGSTDSCNTLLHGRLMQCRVASLRGALMAQAAHS